ncbi:hypothetical protein NL676_020112 [Syzygium grande]|nr:hypothetical protein NL676_020112 [Syzygium grande]
MMMACTKSCFEEVDGKLAAEHNSIPTSRGNRVKQSQCEIRNGHETSQTQKEEEEEEKEEEVTAEFSYLSDTEQMSAINGYTFTIDGSLSPSHLKSRFRKLKSFTLSKPQTTLLNSSDRKTESTLEFVRAEDAISSPSKKRNPDEKSRRKSTTEYDPVSSPMDYPDSWRKSKSP